LDTLFVNPPVLPWYAAENPNGFCALIMNFLTTRSTSGYKNGGHNANYIRSNGQMTESCWQLPPLSLGDEIFNKSLRCDLWPFAYNHKNQHGKPEDIFCPEDLAEIMVHVSKFIETLIRLTAKTNIMSVATLGYIKTYVGEEKIHAFFQSGKLFSLSTKECKPSCHAECFTNEMYKKNVLAPQQAKGWDKMYTNIKAFHGITTPCTSAAACLNVVEGSAEHVLLVEKSKANWAKNAEEQTTKFAKGEGNLQLAAQNELRERGIVCDDARKAQSTLEVIKSSMGEGKFQLAAQKELRERGIECDDARKAQSTLEVIKFAKGEGNLQLVAKKELRERGIKCDDATKAQSILNSINNPMKNPASLAKCSAAKMGALNNNYKGDKWSPDEEKQLRKLCKLGYTMTEIAKKINCDVASRRTVHNKIHELEIRVKYKGEYQLLTKKYSP
jgi:hypothetical protein